jgi:DNA mismatch endonuclease (patch repair protein)
MRSIRGHGNKGTELKLITIFRAASIKGWRRGSKLPGKPDFVFPSLKTAIFVDGCFWHGCPKHGNSPKTKTSYWLAKITGNKARDRRVNRLLRAKGWAVVRVWEHELAKRNTERLLKRLEPLAKETK